MEKKIFTFDKLPQSVSELQQLSSLQSPFETAALVVLALVHYPTDKDAAIEMINYLKGPQLLSTYELQFLRDRFSQASYVPRSYLAGTTPENNYEPSVPYSITVTDNPYSYDQEGYAKLYLQSTGADSPRPIVLRRKGDQWFLWEQLLLSGIRIPKADDPWA